MRASQPGRVFHRIATAFAADAPKCFSGKVIAANDAVHCYNMHDCKGSSDCKTAEHVCKGHSFMAKTAGECLKGNGVICYVKA